MFGCFVWRGRCRGNGADFTATVAGAKSTCRVHRAASSGFGYVLCLSGLAPMSHDTGAEKMLEFGTFLIPLLCVHNPCSMG